MNDFDILKNVLSGNTSVYDLSDEMKQKIIILCNGRIEEIDKRMKSRNKQFEELQKILKEISKE